MFPIRSAAAWVPMLAFACASCRAAAPAAAPAPPEQPFASRPIVRSSVTMSGQPLRHRGEGAEVAVAAVEIAPGGALPRHRHPWSR
ncbi:MAG: hypothetical protein M3N07_09120, partial [Pseudomonadota bacterium]|nr:hypothetical protein [Pseudomonadota bacterium]